MLDLKFEQNHLHLTFVGLYKLVHTNIHYVEAVRDVVHR